ncbi:MAG: flavodoxin domain-containing protein [Anaeroplasmataceae bacterium]|nr:flavodoxin domain-containing protein [Anaeroplasmataceae bacterium]
MIQYVGVNDHQVDLFEGQYHVKNGMSYNSYVILDEKIAIMDTVDIHFTKEWLANIHNALNGRLPDYLIVLHMEPDHSASIQELLEIYPDITIVGNAKTFPMIEQFFPFLNINHKEVVKEGDVLVLGKHSLKFVFAPMIHWPEVMLAYETTTKSLFSADAFGKFGALDVEEDWKEEARRYYIGIVGKYGLSVQNLFKKVAGIEINTIYPLHGPILKENLNYYLDLYNTWSSYKAEEEGICIAYASIYGNTKKAIEELTTELADCKVEVFDLARCDMAEAISKAFQYTKLVVASPTYNNGVFPPVEAFLHGLVERSYQNRVVGIIENGSWAPTAKKYIEQYFSNSKNITILEEAVTVKSSLDEVSKMQIEKLACKLKSI